MTDSHTPIDELTPDSQTNEDSQVEETVEQPVAPPDPQDTAFAQVFRYPTSLETAPNGAWLVWLQSNGDDALELWLCGTEDGSEPFRVDLPFTPVEDRDPDTGRVLRGPQFSPDSNSIAVTGMHPDGDRTAIWIVPVGEQAAEQTETPEVVTADVEPVVEAEAVTEDTEMVATDTEESEEVEVAPESEEVVVAEVVEVTEATVEETVPASPYLLAEHAGADRSPRWSPDGEIIAFTSTIDGRDVIALSFPKEPGPLEMLTWSRSDSREPMWSRDGKFLGFLRPIGGGEGYHDIWSFSLEEGVLTNLTGEKAATVRHSIEWVPGRNLIAYVTVENGWQSISVVNADNKAGWVVTRESGDKTEPRFAPDEARLVYLRTEGFTRVLCERSLHSSASTALDPGEGVVSMARWTAAKRVAYGFSAPQQPFCLFVQENSAKSERVAIQPMLSASTTDMRLIQPQPLEFQVGPEETFSGLLYRPDTVVAGAVYVPEGELHTRRGSFQPEEQALASAGIAVLSPVLHGATGFGVDIENDLREYANTELEITDIAEAGKALGKSIEQQDKVTVVGHGLGGALALVAAGARPGAFAAVVAIDPIADWTLELANANNQWRNWVTDRFGMPLTNADTYALRTPATFSAVIEVPLILVQTAAASASRQAQFEALVADLDAVGVTYTVMTTPAEPVTATLRRVSQRLAETFTDGLGVGNVEPLFNAADI
ncbi:MAG: alpha/beta fold hydrolase [Thermomicrobiales bacterium]|nr:alpha/beta fold hydrolase [Thermomicrobiales bacterium]